MNDLNNLIAQYEADPQPDRLFVGRLFELFLRRSGIIQDDEFKKAMSAAIWALIMRAPDTDALCERLVEVTDEMHDATYEKTWESFWLFIRVGNIGMVALLEKMREMLVKVHAAAAAERAALEDLCLEVDASSEVDTSALTKTMVKLAAALDEMQDFLPDRDEVSQLDFFLTEFARVQGEIVARVGTTLLRDLLTERRNQVADLVADGYTETEIATELNIKLQTVKRHKQVIRQALGIEAGAGRKLRAQLKAGGWGLGHMSSTSSS